MNNSKSVAKRRRILKAKAIKILWWKCCICGYCKSISALDIHHKDPSKKEFWLSSSWITRARHKVEKEITKCELLCANCHRELHNNRTVKEALIELSLYESKSIPLIKDNVCACWWKKNGYSKQCAKCRWLETRVFSEDHAILVNKVKEKWYEATWRDYWVSWNAIRKRIKTHFIETKIRT